MLHYSFPSSSPKFYPERRKKKKVHENTSNDTRVDHRRISISKWRLEREYQINAYFFIKKITSRVTSAHFHYRKRKKRFFCFPFSRKNISINHQKTLLLWLNSSIILEDILWQIRISSYILRRYLIRCQEMFVDLILKGEHLKFSSSSSSCQTSFDELIPIYFGREIHRSN